MTSHMKFIANMELNNFAVVIGVNNNLHRGNPW